MGFKWADKWFCGTSGLVLPVPNKLAYPEEYRDKSRLHYYSVLFNSIEVNSSFYKLPLRRTVDRWCTEVAGDFRFTYKLSKEITHSRDLNFEKQAIDRFFEVVRVPASLSSMYDRNSAGCSGCFVCFVDRLITRREERSTKHTN